MQPEQASQAEEILRFWFEECAPWQWFRRCDAFDRSVSERFGQLTEAAQQGQLIKWEVDQSSALALILLLDQFSRNIWRGQARAYQGDLHAQRLHAAHVHLLAIRQLGVKRLHRVFSHLLSGCGASELTLAFKE